MFGVFWGLVVFQCWGLNLESHAHGVITGPVTQALIQLYMLALNFDPSASAFQVIGITDLTTSWVS